MIGENSPTALLALAVSLINVLAENGILARLFGGLSIELVAPWQATLRVDRPVKDVDIIVPRNALVPAIHVLRNNGWRIKGRNEIVNPSVLVRALHADSGTWLDMYADPIVLNQTIYFGRRLRLQEMTLSPVDLLISKLQIVKITQRDLDDICALAGYCTVAPGDSPDHLNTERLSALCSRCWGFQHSSLLNLVASDERCRTHQTIQNDTLQRVLENLSLLKQTCAECPKSWIWRLRAKIGTNIPWYEEID